MALLFTAADLDSLYVNTPVITGANFALSAWVKPGTSATMMVLAFQDKDVSNQDYQLMLTSAGVLRFRSRSGASGNLDAETVAVCEPDTWSHVAAIATDNGLFQTRRVYLNGGALNNDNSSDYEGANNTVVSPTGLDRASIGAKWASGIVGDNFDGDIAHVAVWNFIQGFGNLSPQDIAALARRVHPTLIKRSNLAACWPFDGLAPYHSPIGNILLTAAGTPASSFGPPVARPSPARAGKDPITLTAADGTPVATAARQLGAPASSSDSSTSVPGVTTRVTSRSTRPLASRGSCTWSQTATRKPAAISRRR